MDEEVKDLYERAVATSHEISSELELLTMEMIPFHRQIVPTLVPHFSSYHFDMMKARVKRVEKLFNALDDLGLEILEVEAFDAEAAAPVLIGPGHDDF